MKKFLSNLRFLFTRDMEQMIEFETEMLERHNELVEDVKAVNLILRQLAGYDSGRYLRPRPGHIDIMTPVAAPATLPMQIASEVDALMHPEPTYTARALRAQEKKVQTKLQARAKNKRKR
jgi:hypothetical protein